MSKKGEGTFSDVLKAQSLKTGEMVAIKRMKSQFDSAEQVFDPLVVSIIYQRVHMARRLIFFI